MNQEPLDVMIRDAVDRVCARPGGLPGEHEVLEHVLAEPDIQQLLKGIDAHDRSEGLQDVYIRDIGRKVNEYLAERQQGRDA